MVILDSDHLSLLERDSFLIAQVIENNLSKIPSADTCTTIISFEEQMRGWLAVLAKCKNIEQEVKAYEKLHDFLNRYSKITVLDFNEKAVKEFQHLKTLKLRVGTMDLKIASIALANDALLLSRNLRDFENIPNLKVEDWTIEQAGERSVKIIVIGSGFGGFSAAIRLQAQGHQVTIVEKRDKPGGRAYVYEQDGFVFDGGPTIITAPWLIDEMFEVAGKKTNDYVKLVKIDPFYNIRFPDGTIFNYNDDKENLLTQIRKFNPNDVEGYKRFAQDLGEIYRVGFELIDQPFTKMTDMLRVVPQMIKLRSDRSVVKFAAKYFKDERLQQAFSFHPLLIGGNPYQATSIYAMIHRLEQEFGVWFAMGGTGALVRGLAELFMDIGGKIFLEAEVDRIFVDDKTGNTTGVYVKNGDFLPADAVVSNADVGFTYLNLIDAKYRRKNTDARIKKIRFSMSLFVIYFGTDCQYPNMAHHEIIMGERYKGLLDEIFVHKTLAKDFSLYLHRPTATDPSLAPPGCDSWYVLSPVPNLGGDIDWTTAAKPYRDSIIKYLEDRYMPNLEQHIVTETYIDPPHFRDTLNSYLGNAFGVEPTLMQSAYFRPHNVSEDIPNLYFVGAGTHPGAGLPGVMSSGKIVAKMIGE